MNGIKKFHWSQDNFFILLILYCFLFQQTNLSSFWAHT
jgi:hypothetical protein